MRVRETDREREMDCEAKVLGLRLSGKVNDKLKNCHDISIINFRFI